MPTEQEVAALLVEETPEALIALSPTGHILCWNRGAQALLGYTCEEAVGRSFVELVAPPEGREEASGALTEVLGSGTVVLRTSCRRRDASRVLVEAALKCVRDPHGEVRFIAVREKDVSETFRLSEVQAGEGKFRGLLEAAPDAMVIVRSDGTIVLVNSQLERLFGYRREELLGKPIELLVAERFQDIHSKHRDRYFGEPRTRPMGAGLDLHGRRRDGTEFPVEISLSPMQSEEGLLVTAAIRDITERKKAETKFRSFVEAAPDAIVIVNREGRIVLLNSQTERLFGYPRSELLDKTVETLVPARSQGRHSQHRAGYFSDPRVRPMGSGLELYGRHKKGTEFPVEISLSPIETEEGLLVSAAIRDISERKLVETQLRASLKEKEILLKEIHHRVKNNLQIVSSMLNLQMRQISDPLALELFKESQTRVRSIALFHEKLYQSKSLAQVDVAGYLKGLATGLFGTYGVNPDDISLSVNAEDVPLSVDAAISCGLIVNELLSNSLKHAFPGGRKGEVRVALRRENEEVVLQVLDDGIGFPLDLDLRSPNTLGLKLVCILAEQIQGSIELDRRDGTRFVVRFAHGTHT